MAPPTVYDGAPKNRVDRRKRPESPCFMAPPTVYGGAPSNRAGRPCSLRRVEIRAGRRRTVRGAGNDTDRRKLRRLSLFTTACRRLCGPSSFYGALEIWGGASKNCAGCRKALQAGVFYGASHSLRRRTEELGEPQRTPGIARKGRKPPLQSCLPDCQVLDPADSASFSVLISRSSYCFCNSM